MASQELVKIAVSIAGQTIYVPKLTGKNYLNWRSIMMDLIMLCGLEGVILGEEENASLNIQAKLLIKCTLDDAHLTEVRDYNKAREVWSHLSRMCIRRHAVMLVREFYSFRYEAGDSMVVHLEKLSNMREQLKRYQQETSDEIFIDRILRTLPSEYDQLKDYWDYERDSSPRTVENLRRLILVTEKKNKQKQF